MKYISIDTAGALTSEMDQDSVFVLDCVRVCEVICVNTQSVA